MLETRVPAVYLKMTNHEYTEKLAESFSEDTFQLSLLHN